MFTDVVYAIDDRMRNTFYARSIWVDDSFDMYLSLDVDALIELSLSLFDMFVEHFGGILALSQQQLFLIRISSFIVFLKAHTDLILRRPYSFVWDILIDDYEVPNEKKAMEDFLWHMYKNEILFVEYTNLLMR